MFLFLKTDRKVRSFITALLLSCCIALIVSSCSEIEVVPVTDYDEIMRLLTDDSESNEFFRVSNFFKNAEYTVVGDPIGLYYDTLAYLNRTILLDISSRSKLHDYGPYIAQDAEALITHQFSLHTTRVDNNGSTLVEKTLTVRQYGYLIKLGDNNRPYSGWKLMGYGYANESSGFLGAVKRAGGSFLYTNLATILDNFEYIIYDTTVSSTGSITVIPKQSRSKWHYLRLDNIPNISSDSILIFDQDEYNLLSAESNSGFSEMALTGVDTLRLPTNNSKLWNLIFLRDRERAFIPPDTLSVVDSYQIIPYRVPQ